VRPVPETALGAASPAAGAAPRSVSLIVPVHNGEAQLAACLECLRRLDPPPQECILVDDGSCDASAHLARAAGFRVLSTGARRGPAFARNLGARQARGDLLVFVDADVLVPPDLVARVLETFRREPGLDALIGSYDDDPAQPGFFSQFRNLMHCYVHQTGREEASTFWSGCGAIRRELFLQHGGFCTAYARPSIEDIELGLRLRRAGARIRLRKDLRVKHLKRWTFREMLRTDVFDRALPWTLLILRRRSMPADLNLRWRYRLSVLAWLGAAAAPALPAPAAGPLAGACAAVGIVSNAGFYRFLAARRGWWFALRCVPVHALFFLYSGLAFAGGLILYALRRGQPEP